MNYIWFFIIIFSIFIGAYTGNLQAVVNATLEGAKTSIDIVIAITGVMVFWLGIMKIAEKSGLIEFLAKILNPIAKILFPEISNNKKAIGDITMNFSANALGLANAATPMGIKAMEDMQEENIDKSSASNAMCTFLAMNTAGFQIIPAAVIAILVANGDKNATEIILPTLIVTSIAFVSAIFIAKTMKRFFPPQEGGLNND